MLICGKNPFLFTLTKGKQNYYLLSREVLREAEFLKQEEKYLKHSTVKCRKRFKEERPSDMRNLWLWILIEIVLESFCPENLLVRCFTEITMFITDISLSNNDILICSKWVRCIWNNCKELKLQTISNTYVLFRCSLYSNLHFVLSSLCVTASRPVPVPRCCFCDGG